MAGNDRLTVEYSTKEVMEKIDNMGTKLFGAINELKVNFDHAINGNGHEGLKTRQTRTEQTLKIYGWFVRGMLVAVIGLIVERIV